MSIRFSSTTAPEQKNGVLLGTLSISGYGAGTFQYYFGEVERFSFVGDKLYLGSNYHYDLSTDELQQINNDLETKKYKISNSEYYITHANGPSTLVINSKANKEIKVYKRLNFDTNSNIGKTIINHFENISKIEKYDKFILNKRKKLKITEYYLFYDYCQYQGSEKEPIVCSTKPLFKINSAFLFFFCKYNTSPK